MNEQCICIPSADECFVRKQSYNKAIEDFKKALKQEYMPCKETDVEIYKKVCNRIDKIAKQLVN